MPLAVFLSHFFKGYGTSLFLLKLEKYDYKHVSSCAIKLKLQKTDHTKLLWFAFWRRSLSLERWTLYILHTFSNIIMTDIMASTIVCSTEEQTVHITSLITLQKLKMEVHCFICLCWDIADPSNYCSCRDVQCWDSASVRLRAVALYWYWDCSAPSIVILETQAWKALLAF